MEIRGDMIKTLNTLLEKRANNNLREDGLTFSQLGMLLACDDAGGSCTLKELERALTLSQPTVAGIAKRLEAKGLLDSTVDADDARAKKVSLSEDGVRHCAKARERMSEADKMLFAGFTAEERSEFGRFVGKAINNCS